MGVFTVSVGRLCVKKVGPHARLSPLPLLTKRDANLEHPAPPLFFSTSSFSVQLALAKSLIGIGCTYILYES